ncbi:MAG TPA: DUF2997 domain-containing protein [Pirellulaceae bacterium]|nr:DUF2997 domain-containing protein [Pirellulaceae bacterium]
MNRTIDIIVAPDGTARIETRGFAGQQCRAASQFLEAALGQVSAERLTPEYYQAATAEQPIEQRQTPA